MSLRDDPTFQCLTNAGLCWKCGGPVIAFFNDDAFDDGVYPSRCFVKAGPRWQLRDCARVGIPLFCWR